MLDIIDTDIVVYHYGWARNDTTLLIKKYFQEVSWWGTDYWNAHEFPFRFDNPEKLPIFKGKHPKYMKETIEKKERWIEQFNDDYNGFPWKK